MTPIYPSSFLQVLKEILENIWEFTKVLEIYGNYENYGDYKDLLRFMDIYGYVW